MVFRPATRLIIRPNIRAKLEAHGVTADLAREFFELFRWDAIPHPVESGEPFWDPPRWVVERGFRGRLYRMVFLMDHPPGTEATLVTFFPEKAEKHQSLEVQRGKAKNAR
jgi:hypothetical protein